MLSSQRTQMQNIQELNQTISLKIIITLTAGEPPLAVPRTPLAPFPLALVKKKLNL